MATVTMQFGTELKDTPVGAYLSAFNPTNRREIYNRAATGVWNLVRRHFREIEPTHHRTANSFDPPATPTGYWEGAIKGTTKKYDANSATVTINQPGITRAEHELHIKAKSKLLTIPARPSPEAYGRRAREVALTERLFFAQTRSGVKMLATRDNVAASISRLLRRKPPKLERPRRASRTRPKKPDTGNLRPVFWLRSEVTVNRDEGILPTKAQITETATNEIAVGVRDFVLGRK